MFEKNPERPGSVGSVTWVYPEIRRIVKTTPCPYCKAKAGMACMNTKNPDFFEQIDYADNFVPESEAARRRVRRTKAQIAIDKANGVKRKRRRKKKRRPYYPHRVHADREVKYALAHPEEYAETNDRNDHDHRPPRRERQRPGHAERRRADQPQRA